MIARIAAILRAEADFLGMSGRDLADKAGVTPATVYRIFAFDDDDGAGFGVSTLLALVDALDLTPVDFFELVEEGPDVVRTARALDRTADEARAVHEALTVALAAYEEARKNDDDDA